MDNLKPKQDQKMITPSAKASVMQPKYKLQKAKLKKGKGSYNRRTEEIDSGSYKD